MPNPAPYMGTVEALVCTDNTHVKELFTKRKLDLALKEIQGYWNVYLTFYGEQTVWLQFSLIDTRDGCVIWRNGQRLKKEDGNGEEHAGTGNPGTGNVGGVDRWIVAERRGGAW